MNRRSFLASTLAAAGLPALGHAFELPAFASRKASAAVAADKKLFVIFAHGGWDTTRALSPMFGATVDMEPDAEPWTVGGLSLVDHPLRPSVRAFFEQYATRCAVLEGILVTSVAHDSCAQIAMTGGTRGTPDWASVVGGLAADRYTLPNLVLDGPTYPAQFGTAAARVGAYGQLDGLVSGELVESADGSPGLMSTAVQGAIDRYLGRRMSARLATAAPGMDEALATDLADVLPRSTALKETRGEVSFAASALLEDRLSLGVEVLSAGLSRAVTMAYPGLYYAWDSHGSNDAIQSPMWEELFAGLSFLAQQLDTIPGPSGAPLADEVMVLVLSEMGRTPLLNSALGKDHWPYTSALLFGGGVPGGLKIGGYQDNFNGAPTDPVSGLPTASGIQIATGHVGATVLALAGEDPGPWAPGIDPLPILTG